MSRRVSAQTVQGSIVSTLPQTEQMASASATRSSALSKGVSAASRFLSRCSTARRAERGPSPGSRASAWVSASISWEAMAEGIEEERLQGASRSRTEAFRTIAMA